MIAVHVSKCGESVEIDCRPKVTWASDIRSFQAILPPKPGNCLSMSIGGWVRSLGPSFDDINDKR